MKVEKLISIDPPSVKYKLEQQAKLDDFEEKEELGKGAFGRVFRAEHKVTGEEYAIKELNKKKSEPISLNREINIMYQLNHLNIVKIYHHFETESFLYIVMELCKGENLHQINSNSRKNLNDKQIAYYFASLVNAVMFLHSQNPPIIHRDIKLDNLIITKSNVNNISNVNVIKLNKNIIIDERKEREKERSSNIKSR